MEFLEESACPPGQVFPRRNLEWGFRKVTHDSGPLVWYSGPLTIRNSFLLSSLTSACCSFSQLPSLKSHTGVEWLARTFCVLVIWGLGSCPFS